MPYDLMVEAFFVDQEHLPEFVTDKLGGLLGITNLEMSIMARSGWASPRSSCFRCARARSSVQR